MAGSSTGGTIVRSTVVSGSDGADAWNGSIFIRADSSGDLMILNWHL